MILNSSASTPLYKQLESVILSEIESGKLAPGMKIPTENELCQQYDVSRVTVRNALASLSRAGYLDRKPGKGTFVAKKKFMRSVSPSVIGFTEMCQIMNKVPRAKTLKIALEEPSEREARQMNISSGESVVVLERLRYADDQPILLEYNKFPESFDFLFKEDFTDCSLYEILQKKYGIHPVSSSKTIDICFASSKEAKLLNISKGYPLLRIFGIIRYSNSEELNLCTQLCIGDKYKIII